MSKLWLVPQLNKLLFCIKIDDCLRLRLGLCVYFRLKVISWISDYIQHNNFKIIS